MKLQVYRRRDVELKDYVWYVLMNINGEIIDTQEIYGYGGLPYSELKEYIRSDYDIILPGVSSLVQIDKKDDYTYFSCAILTDEDKKLLLSKGCKKSDFSLIESAMILTKYTYNRERISYIKAMSYLGREEYFGGLLRSIYHCMSSRDTKRGNTLYFDSSLLFE